jgi:hypothetical protein
MRLHLFGAHGELDSHADATRLMLELSPKSKELGIPGVRPDIRLRDGNGVVQTAARGKGNGADPIILPLQRR